MQKILTEENLRSEMIPDGQKEYAVLKGTVVTPSAREYLKKRGIRLKTDPGSAGKWQTMSRTEIKKQGKFSCVDAKTGQAYREKPEDMTHLRGNLLVPKTNLRIVFRGKLDSLEAGILTGQAMAAERGEEELVSRLGEVLERVRLVLGAEVKETPLSEGTLFGWNHDELRYVSHHVKEEVGIDHPVPDYRMGRMALELNRIRTEIREAELAAVAAFSAPEENGRPDIIEELNRLSSGVYILFCQEAARAGSRTCTEKRR